MNRKMYDFKTCGENVRADNFISDNLYKYVNYDNEDLSVDKTELREMLDLCSDGTIKDYIDSYEQMIIDYEFDIGNFHKYFKEKTSIIEKYLMNTNVKFRRSELKDFVYDCLMVVPMFSHEYILNQTLTFMFKTVNDVAMYDIIDNLAKDIDVSSDIDEIQIVMNLKIKDYFNFIGGEEIICKPKIIGFRNTNLDEIVLKPIIIRKEDVTVKTVPFNGGDKYDIEYTMK